MIRSLTTAMRLAWLIAAILAGSGRLQAQVSSRLYELEPYDEVTLVEDNVVLKVFPLDLPKREPLKAPDRSAPFKLRLLDKPEQWYEVSWDDVAGVKLFEEILLESAARLVAEAEFDEAWRYYDLLRRDHDEFPGVDEAIAECLFAEAAHWNDEGRKDRAVGLLFELHALDPANAQARATLSALVDEMMAANVETDPAAARNLLTELASRDPDNPVVARWRGELVDRAASAVAAAREHADAGRLREAHVAVDAALRIWPELDEGRELADLLRADYPVIVVGVTSRVAPLIGPAPWPESWTGRRIRRLLYRQWCEPVDWSESGVTYASPFGSLATEGLSVTLTVSNLVRIDGGRAATAGDLAAALIGSAGDGGNPALAGRDWLAGVEVPSADSVVVRFTKAMPTPQAWLQATVAPRDASASAESFGMTGPALPGSVLPDATSFRLHTDEGARASGAIREIVEQEFTDSAAVVQALRAGRIAVAERLNPWEVPGLADIEDVAVERYAAPSVHFLVPNLERWPTSQSEFRRALVYALDRPRLLSELAASNDPADGQVVSGPFPLGAAYDRAIVPRPFDPDLARALAGMVRDAAGAGAGVSEGRTERLVLVHSPDEIARRACLAIGRELDAVLGIAVDLVEELPGGSRLSGGDFDLAYVEWPAMDPAVDAFRVLGGTAAAAAGPAWHLGLARLWRAGDSAAAQRELTRLHRVAHEQSLVIPMWQLAEYLAFRPRQVEGIGQRPLSLYQNVEAWRVPAP